MVAKVNPEVQVKKKEDSNSNSNAMSNFWKLYGPESSMSQTDDPLNQSIRTNITGRKSILTGVTGQEVQEKLSSEQIEEL